MTLRSFPETPKKLLRRHQKIDKRPEDHLRIGRIASKDGRTRESNLRRIGQGLHHVRVEKIGVRPMTLVNQEQHLVGLAQGFAPARFTGLSIRLGTIVLGPFIG